MWVTYSTYNLMSEALWQPGNPTRRTQGPHGARRRQASQGLCCFWWMLWWSHLRTPLEPWEVQLKGEVGRKGLSGKAMLPQSLELKWEQMGRRWGGRCKRSSRNAEIWWCTEQATAPGIATISAAEEEEDEGSDQKEVLRNTGSPFLERPF